MKVEGLNIILISGLLITVFIKNLSNSELIRNSVQQNLPKIILSDKRTKFPNKLS